MSKKRHSALDMDPAVASLVAEGKKRKKRRRMSPEDREEAKRQAERNKVTYDIPRGIQEAVTAAGEQEDISASTMAAILLAIGLRHYREQQPQLDGLKVHSRSPRWKYIVNDSSIVDIWQGRRELGDRSEK